MQAPASLVVVTQNAAMREILDRVRTIAESDTSVLLVGETGVGKELFADYIHRASARATRPFVKISLSAMPHDLLESELFGHERGAFTNAIADKRGLFEIADTGHVLPRRYRRRGAAGASQAAAGARDGAGDAGRRQRARFRSTFD